MNPNRCATVVQDTARDTVQGRIFLEVLPRLGVTGEVTTTLWALEEIVRAPVVVFHQYLREASQFAQELGLPLLPVPPEPPRLRHEEGLSCL